MSDAVSPESHHRDSWFSVFAVFLRLGLTSFGGPVAHLGYFRDAFVARRKWLDEAAYTDIIALSNSCRDRRAARSASPSAFCAPACPALSPPGSVSAAHRRWR
jgi:hypothetical protein